MQEKTWAKDRSEQLTAKGTQIANTLKRCASSRELGKRKLQWQQGTTSYLWDQQKCKSLTLITGKDTADSRSIHFGTTTLECNPLQASNRILKVPSTSRYLP